MQYKIAYIKDDEQNGAFFICKKDAIKFYINILGSRQNISELKIFKNDIDITIKVNKFLYK